MTDTSKIIAMRAVDDSTVTVHTTKMEDGELPMVASVLEPGVLIDVPEFTITGVDANEVNDKLKAAVFKLVEEFKNKYGADTFIRVALLYRHENIVACIAGVYTASVAIFVQKDDREP